jgi:hypothetical protein
MSFMVTARRISASMFLTGNMHPPDARAFRRAPLD